MKALNNIWVNYTYEFSPVQRGIVAVILAMIFIIAMIAVVLLFQETITAKALTA